MSKYLPYDPGVLPVKNAPYKGDSIEFEVDGIPPVKRMRISARNPKNPSYGDFLRLRNAAIKSMDGRAWYFGPISLSVLLYVPEDDEPNISVFDYIGGIEDTLDGSSGVHFTYLPVVYEDDCQIVDAKYEKQASDRWHYVVNIKFM